MNEAPIIDFRTGITYKFSDLGGDAKTSTKRC
jgi:hypothetical protein